MATAEDYVKECKVCRQDYVNPKLLPCHHSFCQTCIDSIREGSCKIACPVCRCECDVDNLVADFRHAEYLQALKEKERTHVKIIPKPSVTGTTQCELCRDKPIAHRCTECAQWICDSCKTSHLNAKISQKHRVETLESKNKVAEFALQNELRLVSRKLGDVRTVVDDLKREAGKTKETQQDVKNQCTNLREECMRELSACFDRIDNEILGDFNDYFAKIDGETEKAEKHLQDREAECEKLEDTIKNNTQLAIDGNSILVDLQKLSGSIVCPDIKIESIEACITRNDNWDAAKAAMLNVNGGHIELQASKRFTEVARNRKWTQKGKVTVPAVPHATRGIGGRIWQCHRNGISIYDESLRFQRTIVKGEMKWVYDVAAYTRDQIVVAAFTGLYVIDIESDERSLISNGCFTGVVEHGDTMYAVNCETCTVHAYKHDGDWMECHSFSLQFAPNFTISLSVSRGMLFTSGSNDDTVYVLSLTGQFMHTYGSAGSGDTGLLREPHICDSHEQKMVLVADRNNDRIQWMGQDNEWHVMTLDQLIQKPRGACLVNGRLYVNSMEDMSLIMYG